MKLTKDSHNIKLNVPGTIKMVGDHVYMVTNFGGTLERGSKIKWWAIIYLFALQRFGKCTSISEVRSFFLRYQK